MLSINSPETMLMNDRKKDCTFCKTYLPSLFFSHSPDSTLPSEHHLPSSLPNEIASAQAGAEKGKDWTTGLTLPGTLDLTAFEFVDDKLGVVFENEEIVSVCLCISFLTK